MYNQIDASSSISLILLLAIISPAFCSERNRANFTGISSVKEHLRVDSHVSEIYLSNETFQNSSILSNENQTLQTSSENQNISITLQTPLRNSYQFENLTIIDPNSNSSYINKENTWKVNASIATNSTETSNVSIIEENLNLNNKSNQNAHFNQSNVLKFYVTEPESNAEINSNSIFNSSGNYDGEVLNSSYSRVNITGVGIKATVSVSLQLMGNGKENVTNILNKTESSHNLTESNQNRYNISSNFNVTEDYSSVTSPNTNNTNDYVTDNGNSSEIITNANNASIQNLNITTVDYQSSEIEISTQNGTLTASSVADTSNATVTDSEIPNNIPDTTLSSDQDVTDFSKDIIKATTYTSIENITETSSEEISETTSSFLHTTITEETTTTEKQPLTKMAGVLKIVRGLNWKPEFINHHTEDYINTAKYIRTLLEHIFNLTNLKKDLQEIQIDGFSEGHVGVVIDYILILKTDRLDKDGWIHTVNSQLKHNNYLLGNFTIDPNATHFEVIREETTEPTSAPSIEPPVPQWVIAVVVISAASFIFILLFSAVTIYERHYTRRVYNTKLQDDEEAFEKSITLNGRSSHAAYENLAADLIYDIDKKTHNTGKPFDSWRTEAGQFMKVKPRSYYKY